MLQQGEGGRMGGQREDREYGQIITWTQCQGTFTAIKERGSYSLGFRGGVQWKSTFLRLCAERFGPKSILMFQGCNFKEIQITENQSTLLNGNYCLFTCVKNAYFSLIVVKLANYFSECQNVLSNILCVQHCFAQNKYKSQPHRPYFFQCFLSATTY